MHGRRFFPRTIQLDDHSCGVHVAHCINKWQNIDVPYKSLYRMLECTEEDGTSDTLLERYFRKNGLRAWRRYGLTLADLKKQLDRGAVVIAHVDEGHYVTVHGIGAYWVYLSDPSWPRCPGRVQSRKKFKSRWGSMRWGLIVLPE